jgi:hypothetical protein
MIKHVVFMKFKEGTEESAIAEIETSLGALPGRIPEIYSYEFGRDVIGSNRSYDFALVSAFADLEALDRYRVHPDHQQAVQKITEACSSILAVDFEF